MAHEEFKIIGVVGAGQMGSGIAQVAAMKGFQVHVLDVAQGSLDKGLAAVEKSLSRLVKKEKLSEAEKMKALQNLKWGTEAQSLFADADVVIEAATENLNLKLEIFKNLDQVCPEKTILCSNTSSISITKLASATSRPEKFCGMHFMNPVPIMKLVEGISGLQTSKETFERLKSFAENLGKVFVEAQDQPGFVVNRILMPMINEAVFALYEGLASAEDIDKAMILGTNQPMGPLALADFIGLDTCLSIMEVLHEGFADSKYRPCPLLKKYVEAGWLGRKVKKGFYSYE